jgi:ABC-2 type transport system ATP-binding protein
MYTVEVDRIQKSFGSVQAVEDVSFKVEPGEIFGLLGPNGAGKTTSIRVMLDIFQPDHGKVFILGGAINAEKKHRIGYLPEERGLYKDLRLDATLVYLATLKGVSKKEAVARLQGWLERLDLDQHRSKKIKELSRGMQQKAQLITTFLHEPELIVIDEPFSGLDPVNTRLVKEIIEEQRLAGRSIIMSTHQMNQVEALCNRILLIHHGKSILYGAVNEIKRNFAGNSLLIEGAGDFSALPGVLDARKENGQWHLTLGPDVHSKDVFQELARSGASIDRFEVAEPSLDDIFIQVVGAKDREITDA